MLPGNEHSQQRPRDAARHNGSIVVSGPPMDDDGTIAPSTIRVIRNRQWPAAMMAATTLILAVYCMAAIPIACAASETMNETTTTTAASMTATTSNDTMITRKYVRTGNELWDGLVNECMEKPSFTCFQKNVYHYLDDTLRAGDVNVTSGFRFVRNQLDATSLRADDVENSGGVHTAEEDDEDVGRSASPLEEVTDALSGKSVDFLMTHNMELRMPDMMFDGATIKISPRSFEGNGALVHFEIVPAAQKVQEAGRILFKPLKKLKKLFRNKLLLSFLAIVLIVKLIKIKLFWILPFIVGVGTAKKLLLKVILFLFPALAHIFKLCSHYHKNYHDGTKYHHHNHQISHLHSQVVPPWLSEPPHDHSSGAYSAHEPELIYTSPPKGHPSEYLHGGPPQFQQHAQDWEFSGPGLGSEYISDRNTHVNAFKTKLDEFNEVSSLGGVRGTTTRLGAGRPLTPTGVHPVAAAPNLEPYAKLSPNRIITSSQYHRQVITPKHGPTVVQPQQQVPSQYATVTDEKMLREAQRLQAKQLEALRIQAEQKLVNQQQQILHHQPFVYNPDATPQAVVVDPVYSPILQKVDKIMLQLSFTDEPCKERLICSMYKSPLKYSPHSNFVSAELSRDMSELHKPTASNAAVLRFYRYVQAARDGQDQRDCLQIYGQCTINTEK